MQRVKYPLTTEAKEAAKKLVEAWDEQKIDQYFVLSQINEEKDKPIRAKSSRGVWSTEFEPPLIGVLLELSKFQLVSIDTEPEFIKYAEGSGSFVRMVEAHRPKRWYVVLMQELRNAVENDFDVSDYFLTFNAVGTIITGDNVTFSGPFQSAASI